MKRRVKNHFGFSLIEMVVAFAILGVASLAIGGFFVSSSRSYSSSSSETGLQYEAQMALNQIEGKLIDATLGVNYNLVTKAADASGSTHNYVTSDTIADNLLDSKVLYIFDYKNSAFDALLVKWDIASKELLYKEVSLTNSFNEQTLVSSIPLDGNWELLAEGVKSFSVDLSKYLETKTVDVTMKLAKQRREFETSGTITLRNNVLVNTSKVSDIYKNMSGATATRIDDVFLSANTNVTKPGGTIQLTTKVTGVYPSQEIAGWLIAHSYDQTNEYILGTVDPTDLVAATVAEVNANKELLVKQVPEDAVLDTLFVQAYVNIGNGQYKYSNIVTIHVRNITGITILPKVNLTVNGNGTLTQGEVDKWTAASTGSMNTTPANIYPSNVIGMETFISGTFNSSDEIKVVWTIDDIGEGVLVKIDENTGALTVDRNSKQGRCIVKASVQGTEYWAKYAFAVSSPYANNPPTIRVTAPLQMNRGQAPYQCTVKINDAPAYASDFDWSVRVETTAGQLVTGNPVTINANGLLTVTNSLSFDYSYKITVYATLKSDSNIYGASIVTVPRVTMYLSTTEAITPRIGETIPAGKIICTVAGLENYDINWTIAKETNPTYYFTAYGKTNITGAEVKLYAGTANEYLAKTAKIVIGDDEPKTLSYVRAKATLAGHSNYSTTLKLTIGQSVNEGTPDLPDAPEYEDVNPDVSFEATIPTFTNQSSITVRGKVDKPSAVSSVKVNGIVVSVASDGTFSTPVSMTPGENPVRVEVTSNSGHKKSMEKTVICDQTAPTLTVEADSTTFVSKVAVEGTVADTYGITSLYVNGTLINVALDGTWSTEIDVPLKGATITAVATDKAGNTTTVTKNITYIQSSNSFQVNTIPEYTNQSSITVSGTLNLPAGVKSVKINGSNVTPNTDGTFSKNVSLNNGENTVTIVVTSNAGEAETYTKNVIRDSEAPTVTITSPTGTTTSLSKLTVTGTVSDNYGVSTLTVNGQNVTVSENGSWTTEVNVSNTGVTIEAIATDRAGNTSDKATKTITYKEDSFGQTAVTPSTGEEAGEQYQISGEATVNRGGSVTLTAQKRNNKNSNTWYTTNVIQNSWILTGVKVNGQSIASTNEQIRLIQTESTVTVYISPTFRLEYMDKEIEISINAKVRMNGNKERKFSSDKIIKVNPIELNSISPQIKNIYVGSPQNYTVTLNNIVGGMNQDLYDAGVRLEWSLHDVQTYSNITKQEIGAYGSEVSISAVDLYYGVEMFSLRVSLKYQGQIYMDTTLYNIWARG